MNKHIIIIAGSRNVKVNEENYAHFAAWVDFYLQNLDPSETTILSGGARGIDRLGEIYAKKHNIECYRCPADWDRFGKSAGYRRNERMAEFATHLIAFPTDKRETSKGTHHMIDIARRKGLKVKVVHALANFEILPKFKYQEEANEYFEAVNAER